MRSRSTNASRRSCPDGLTMGRCPRRYVGSISSSSMSRTASRRADQLVEALTTDIGWIRQHTDFGEVARRWSTAGRPGGLLLRSPMLEEVERWIASRPRSTPEATADMQAFVADSRRGATRRRNPHCQPRRRLRRLARACRRCLLAARHRRRAAADRRAAAPARRGYARGGDGDCRNSLVFELAQRFRYGRSARATSSRTFSIRRAGCRNSSCQVRRAHTRSQIQRSLGADKIVLGEARHRRHDGCPRGLATS